MGGWALGKELHELGKCNAVSLAGGRASGASGLGASPVGADPKGVGLRGDGLGDSVKTRSVGV